MTSLALRHHVADFLSSVLSILGPPAPPRRLSEVAGSLRITEGKRGPRTEAPKGDLLDPNEHHGQRAALRLVASRRHKVNVVIDCPQDGKDTGIVAPLMVWSLNDLRRPVVYAATDKRLIGSLWRAKIEATMRASGYGHLFPDDGAGSNGGTPDDILFSTGVRAYLLGAGSVSGGGQAGVTAWLVVITEADKLRIVPRERIQDRNKSYADDALTLLIGTIDIDGQGGLHSLYSESTMGRLHHPCRHCGAWQPLEPDQVEYDATNADLARSTARIKCRAMGCLWTEEDRQWSHARSAEVYAGQSVSGPPDAPVVTGDPIPSEYGGLRLWAMDSPFRSLPAYAVEKRRCKEILARTGDHGPLRMFTRAEDCLPYQNQDEVLELREADLALRSTLAIHKRGESPADADICTVAIDQQLRRLLFVVLAYRTLDKNWWIIDYGFKGVCTEGEQPTDDQRRAALSAVEARVMAGYNRPSGHLLKPMIGGVDTADGETRRGALPWILARPGWHALRGQGGDHDASDATGEAIFRMPGVLTIYNQTKSTPHWQQIAPAVDLMKADVTRDFARKPNTPGAGHLPQGEGAQDDLIRQLCAERQEMTDKGPVWVQKRRHNHYFDCTVYAKTLAEYLAHLRLINSGNKPDAAVYAARMAKG
ncbi:MAG TPA: terminase gpA endonuclease subunit [Planctomycetota bacterium]|jgi:phage terminase large subunit GpA-like protein|nr:terminase gpA endonuclease subunit [Planctomycetota bacterium]